MRYFGEGRHFWIDGSRGNLFSFVHCIYQERGATIIYATHIFDGMEKWATHMAFVTDGLLKRGGPTAGIAVRALHFQPCCNSDSNSLLSLLGISMNFSVACNSTWVLIQISFQRQYEITLHYLARKVSTCSILSHTSLHWE